MTRTVTFYEGHPATVVGTIRWDGQHVTMDVPAPLKADLEAGVQDADAELFPTDGEAFLDAVLQEFAGAYLWTEETQ